MPCPATIDTDTYEVVLTGVNRANCGTYTKFGRPAAIRLANVWIASALGRRAILTRLGGEPEIIEEVEG